jgi:hypothetical protein
MNFKWKRSFNEGKQDARKQFAKGVTPDSWFITTTSFFFDPSCPYDLGSAYACQLAKRPSTPPPWKQPKEP